MKRLNASGLPQTLGTASGLQAVLAILFIYLLATASTWIAASLCGTPFSLWFTDTPYLLGAVLILLIVLGIVWDGSLISFGLVCEILGRRKAAPKAGTISVESMRKLRFFTCGPQPMAMIVLTLFAILGTSNITLISLKLLGHVTHWRDAFLWAIEGSAIEWIAAQRIDIAGWDKLYHSAWGIELLAAFMLIVVGRGARLHHFCISLILLFYIGRFLGLLNPVMGPAFFQPELFVNLAGSVSEKAMQLVSTVMAQEPEAAIEQGGILLGGVSAMPSLHVAMVFVTAYWLMVAQRWTLLITIPWVLLVWASTVILGWHYILDGAGGIALGAGCVWLTRRIFSPAGKGD